MSIKQISYPAIILSFLTILPIASAVTIYVDDDGPADFNNIQAAIDDANDGDEIIVADGTYTGAGNYNIGFRGKAITVKSQNGPENCIIDCNRTGYDNRRGFILRTDEDANSVIDGLTITNGYDFLGGAIYCNNSSPIIKNCIFRDNQAYYGGAIDTGNHSRATIINCTFTDNSAIAGGGAIRAYNSDTLVLNNCTFINNTTKTSGYDGGGAICNRYSTMVLNNCTFINNVAYAEGGAIENLLHSTLTLTNCSFTGNSAVTGGAIESSYDSDVTITNCILWANHSNFGAQIALVESTLNISYSDVQGGQPDVFIMYEYDYDPSIINWGAGNIDIDPRFAFEGDFHLMADSPCIDAGTNEPNGGLPAMDSEGVARPLDGNGDGIPVADIGAFEYNPFLPRIAVAPEQLTFVHFAGQPNPDNRTLSLRNCGQGRLRWQLDENCPWLGVNPDRGRSTGEIDEVTVSINADGLPLGDYRTTLTVSDAHAVNSPKTIPVTLLVRTLHRVPSQYNTIQAAIDASVNGDVVLVAPGTYTGDGNKNLNFGGRVITVKSENGPDDCIIDCEGSGRGFYLGGVDRDSVVDGFTIRYADEAISCGGLYSSPTITNCKFIENYSYAISVGSDFSSNPKITNCQFIRNYDWAIRYSGFGGGGMTLENCIFTEHSKGAIYHSGHGSYLVMENCTFTNNSTPYEGGAIYNSEGLYLSLKNCTFTNNSSGDRGGAIASRNIYNLKLENCTFTNNSAGYQGGAILNRSHYGTTTLENCTFTNNSAGWGGAIYNHNNNGITTLKNCIFNGNSAGFVGAIVNFYGNLMLENCTLAGNSAQYCGAIHTRDDDITDDDIILKNCTITGNRADELGGAIDASIGSNITITNCILWDNTSADGNNIVMQNATLNILYSDVQGGQSDIYIDDFLYKPPSIINWGIDNIDADPCFVDPGYRDPNGTHTDPNDDFWVDGDYHLLEDSPCINTGDPNHEAGPDETDLDGKPRVALGRIDMGAYEYYPLIEAAMKLTPQKLNCNSGGNRLKAHFTLPPGFTSEDIDTDTPATAVITTPAGPVEIESEYITVHGGKKGPVKVEVGFDRSVFCSSLIVYGYTEVQVFGPLSSGGYFYGTDYITTKGPPPGQAYNPGPADGATDVGVYTGLHWMAGADTTSHDVYFGTANPPPFIGNQTTTTFYPGTMDELTTYYWQIDEVGIGGITTGRIWSFTTGLKPIPPIPGQAHDPSPADGATDAGLTTHLGWLAGPNTTSHDIYFGTANPPPFVGNQTATTFYPGTLNYETTYYWQIDEVNPYATTAGSLWSFTTEPAPIPGQAHDPNPADGTTDVNITADLSFSAGPNTTSHDVYFGTANPPPFIGNQISTTFNPGTLNYETTYYWQIDEVNPYATTTGLLWSFTTRESPVIDHNLISWWKFDEGTGKIAYDSAGDNDGTIYRPDWTSGKIGGALGFGYGHTHVRIGDKVNLEPANLTLSFWTRHSYPSYSFQGGVAKGNIFGMATSFSYTLDFHQGQARAAITNTSDVVFVASASIPDNDWYMWTMTVDNDTLSIYRDGALQAETAYTGPVDYDKNYNDFVIGARYGGDYSLRGKIDDVRVYDGALSPAEVLQLYQGNL